MDKVTTTWLKRAECALRSALEDLQNKRAVGLELKPHSIKTLVATAFRNNGFDKKWQIDQKRKHPLGVESVISSRVRFHRMKTVDGAIQLLSPVLSNIEFALEKCSPLL